MTTCDITVRRWRDLDAAGRAKFCRPASAAYGVVGEQVRRIFDAVAEDGDAAVRAFSREFDGVAPSPVKIPVPTCVEEVAGLEPEDLSAMETAARNIETFHGACISRDVTIETMPGVSCSRMMRPIGTVGLYVPGGSAPLFSTLLMLAIPARLAGVGQIVVATPPGASGPHPAVLAAASLCGISEIFLIGGAQAIAAMALGTAEVPRVDKVFGPGNIFVNEAKRYAASLPGGPAIDLPAGPSEVLVIADCDANPDFVAADLLAQAEHDAIARPILLTDSPNLAELTVDALGRQLSGLSRAEIAAAALDCGGVFVVDSLDAAVDISNEIAPEHLIINTRDPEALLQRVTSAGSIFLGPWTPESVGDYASGTNHVLPTAGAGRAWSGVSVASFQKAISVQSLSGSGLEALGPVVERLSDLEGLDGHRNAVSIRLSALRTAAAGEGA